MTRHRLPDPVTISFIVYILSNMVYAVFTLPLLTVTDPEIWYMSVFFALGGSAVFGLPPFLFWMSRLCRPGWAQSAEGFRRAVYRSALVCAAAGALIVTFIFMGMFGVRHIESPMVLMTMAGILCPLPALLLLHRTFHRLYQQINADAHEYPAPHP